MRIPGVLGAGRAPRGLMAGQSIKGHRAFGRPWAAAVAAVWAALAPVNAAAETLQAALAYAYQSNPQLNAQRAALRAIDEGVAQALSGYRPTITGNASVGAQYSRTVSEQGGQRMTVEGATVPRSVGVTTTQTLFNGLQTANRTRAAESQVSAEREALRLMEQTVLLDAVTAYMNVLRDAAILDLQRRNVEVLREQLRQTNDRFRVGEVTRTDVAQAESRLAAAQSQQQTAASNYTISQANYRRIIGRDPVSLNPATPVDRFVPNTLDRAVVLGRAENPQVGAAMFGVDVALLNVKIAEGALYPNLVLQGNVQQNWDPSPSTVEQFSASVVARLTIPIYQGGTEYATIRQNKERLGQSRLNLDLVRDQVRALVVQSWAQLQAAKAQIQSVQSQVSAAEIALNGVREEARVGQRTTLDVLNAQQELVNARVSLVTAQRDRVVASYTLLASVGRLSPVVLGLPTALYDPQVHYHQVRDQWFGVRTPDGR